MTVTAKPEVMLAEDMAGFRFDPLGYVLYAFPWGEKGTELEGYEGPRRWQRELLEDVGRKLREGRTVQEAVASGHGIGKALPMDSRIPTPGGWRTMRDLRVGDLVFGRDGTPTAVKGVWDQGIRPVYRIRFDDGSEVLADAEHKWSVRGRKERRKGLDGWRTMTTAEILSAGARRSNGVREARQWEIPRQGAAQYSCRAGIDPYLLGAYLGDGCWNHPRLTSGDGQLWEILQSRGCKLGKKVQMARNVLGGTLKGYMGSRTENKRVPREMMTCCEMDRRDLIRGLLDTDGTVSADGRVTFCSTSAGLVDDVVELARSLGWKASRHCAVRKPFYRNGEGVKVMGLPAYNCTIQATECPFLLDRKARRWKGGCQSRYLSRWIDGIDYVGEQETRCITVSAEDGLFLCDHYVVTHNSAEVAWIILWALSTHEDTRGVVTANTDPQLKTKTWPELAKWHRLAINKEWFTFTATALYSSDAEHEKTWRVDAVAWSENRTEAFAGLHNQGKRILLLFDEASAIADKIWEVSEGALTDEDTEIVWAAFGNPTRNTGRFRECFGSRMARWGRRQIDSRYVEGTSKEQIESWVADYGEDSDFVRVRVRGQFPSAGSMQFIGTDVVQAAMTRNATWMWGDPLVMALDVARGGMDRSVFRFRRGFDGRTIAPVRIPGSECADSMRLVSVAVDLIEKHSPDLVVVDETGVGGPVGDRLRQLGHSVVGVQFGSSSPDPRYKNMRAYMWGKGRDWLQAGGAVENSRELEADLTGVEFSHNDKDQLVLEKKEHMRSRGLASPDDGDALMMTFAYPVGLKGAWRRPEEAVAKANTDWDPYIY